MAWSGRWSVALVRHDPRRLARRSVRAVHTCFLSCFRMLLTSCLIIRSRHVQFPLSSRFHLWSSTQFGEASIPRPYCRRRCTILRGALSRFFVYFPNLFLYLLLTLILLTTAECEFNSNFCQWSNDRNGQDDFDWSLSRGSLWTHTGPIRDELSSRNNWNFGGYAYIDSREPHFAGSRTSLSSPVLPATTTSALCFSFWVHMFGAGIGHLRYKSITIKYISFYSFTWMIVCVFVESFRRLRPTHLIRRWKFGASQSQDHVILGIGLKWLLHLPIRSKYWFFFLLLLTFDLFLCLT